MIFLDNASTTPLDSSAVNIYKKYATEDFFNPSAAYFPATTISKKIDETREKIKNILHVRSGEVIFTSGATESNNLAIKGSIKSNNGVYISSKGEHPSVYNTFKSIKDKNVKFISLTNEGSIDLDELKNNLSDDTRLISCIHVSNEMGTINDISEIVKLRDKYAKKALIHIDGVQAFGKIDLNINGIDLYTISAHKLCGPKGLGALYIKNKNQLNNIIEGGGQEYGIRSGTENVPAILAFSEVLNNLDVKKNYEHVLKLRNTLLDILTTDKNISYFKSNNFSPYILSVRFKGINGETMLHALEEKEIFVSTGSACSSKKAGNRILEASSLNIAEIKSSVRFSFNYKQTIEEIEEAGNEILNVYHNLISRLGGKN